MAMAAAAALPAHGATINFEVDPSHTWVFYEIVHFGTSTNRGRLPVKAGKVQLDAHAKIGKVDVTVDTMAPASGVPALDKMLQGERLFRSSEFPTARFVAGEVRFEADKPVELKGDLTLLGVTHPVTLKSLRYNCFQHPMLKRDVCGGDFETTIQRSRWGMGWGAHIVSDEVRLLIQVEAVKQVD
jgi:polyisoprenoid-binding protein YceI